MASPRTSARWDLVARDAGRSTSTNRQRQPRKAGPLLVACFAIFMGVVGSIFWLVAPGAGTNTNPLVPEYPVQTLPPTKGPFITVQTLP